MGNDFPTSTLEEMCELIVDCPHSTPKWTGSGVVVLRNQNIRNGVLDLSSPSYTDEAGYLSRVKRAVPQAGDIVITREAPMGEVCVVPKGLKCCLGQRQVLLRPKRGVSTDYLFWALQSPYVQHQVSWNEGTGTTVSNIRIPVLKAFKIPRQGETESKIAKPLVDIADKIQVNTQINQTLEQMAQTLFKSWFVDFDPVLDNALDAGSDIPEVFETCVERRKAVRESADFKPLPDDVRQLFPSEFEESELGWVPKGWDTKSIKDFGKVVTGKTPPKKIEGAYGDKGVPFITPTDIDKDVFVIGTKRFLTETGVEVVKKNLLPEDSICVTCIGSQMGKAVISPTMSISNQQINSVITKKEHERIFLFLNLRSRREEIFLVGSSGSTMPIINKSTFEKLPVLVPDDAILKLFDSEVAPLLNRIHSSSLESKTLSTTRDTLLPKLISGELRLDSPQVEQAKAPVE